MANDLLMTSVSTKFFAWWRKMANGVADNFNTITNFLFFDVLRHSPKRGEGFELNAE